MCCSKGTGNNCGTGISYDKKPLFLFKRLQKKTGIKSNYSLILWNSSINHIYIWVFGITSLGNTQGASCDKIQSQYTFHLSNTPIFVKFKEFINCEPHYSLVFVSLYGVSRPYTFTRHHSNLNLISIDPMSFTCYALL